MLLDLQQLDVPGGEGASEWAARLKLEAGGTQLETELRIQGARLWIGGSEGRIEGDRAHARELRLQVGGSDARAPELRAEHLRLGWGEQGFWLEAAVLEGPSLTVALGEGAVEARGVRVVGLSLHGSDVAAQEASVEGARVDLTWAAAGPADGPVGEPQERAPAARAAMAPSFDWRALDGLSGEVNVDLHVDLTVPIIGRRRATHRFRVPIEQGSVDYLQLEGDLSTLENTLLDFAVRDDGTLVLERGIPLLPTRGRGKPILVWDLAGADRALAKQNRVRLAVVPQFRLASPPSEPPPETTRKDRSGSGISLRRLGLGNLQARLGLRPSDGPLEGPLRSLSVRRLELEGNLHHDPDGEPREGEVRGRLEGHEASLAELVVGGHQIDLERLRLERLDALRVRFAGMRPTALTCDVGALLLARLSLKATP
jgi:hypothetical protein